MATGAVQGRFQLEDLLFSRTDSRGVIQAGNEVFQRVSVYSWEKMIGAPHKIVRHDTMPSGVFYLMWEGIKRGDPIGAYVLNNAEDGTPYWVFAAVLPIEDGYVSQRLMPTSETFDMIRPVYKAIRAREKAGELTPEASAEALVEELQSHGFADYQHFMCYAIREECAAREKQLRRSGDTMRDRLGKMLVDIREMEAGAAKVDQTFKNTHQIPYNMRLQAGRLEGSDGPISVISSNHRQMTQSLEDNLVKFIRESKVGAEAIRMALFKTSVSLLMDEMSVKFQNETGENPCDRAAEKSILDALGTSYREQALRDVKEISSRVQRFGNQCRDMRRMMSGLELTRIMCKIERSKFDGDHAGLDEIVNRLSDAQDSLNESFDAILQYASRIVDQGELIQRDADYSDKRRVA